jgi:hypothetical protein
VSVNPVTKTGVLFGRKPAGTAPALDVPVSMLSTVPDLSTDMRLLAAGSKFEESEPVAMCLGCPLG